MITPLKLGIAVACLVGVAILIAVDLGSNRKHEVAPPATVAPANPLPAPPPPVLPATPVAAAAPEPVTICPQPPTKDSEPAARAEAPKKAVEPAPVVEKKTPKESTETPSDEPRNYTVVQGDTLYGISVKLFGTPRHYEKIYELNRDRIRDPNSLQVGINLKLPDVPRTAPATNVGQSPARD
jgi:nucleoid-associated protein YgaU